MRPGDAPDTPAVVTRYTLRRLARRYQQLDAEATNFKAQMARFVDRVAPDLVAQQGINTLTAAALLVAAVTTPSGYGPRARSRTCAVWHHSTRRRADSNVTGSTAAGTAKPTARCTASRSCA
jgi:hypothetical protein